MQVVFRVDASVDIGAGHLMRCVCLAEALRQGGSKVVFICRDLPGKLWELAAQSDFPVQLLPDDGHFDWERDAQRVIEALPEETVDWLIVDHYGLDERWESALRPKVGKIMAIDDVADRRHDCDLLLDVNLHDNPHARYHGLLPRGCQTLYGPTFALLRSEFAYERERLRNREGDIQRVLVLFGGSDPTNETYKAVQAVSMLGRKDLATDVVVGAAYPNRERLEQLCLTLPKVTLHRQVSNVANLMAQADLAIGAGGGTTWERCCLGLPALVSILSENQRALTEAVARQGAIHFLGWSSALRAEDYREALTACSPEARQKMSKQALPLVDGLGSTRVASALRPHN